MPAPTTITESALRAYAHAELGDLASQLSFTIEGGSYDPVVNAALADYGVEDPAGITGVSEVALLLACTRYALWRYVTSLTNSRFNLGADGASLSLAQINEHARASAKQAKEERDELRSRVAAASGGGVLQAYDVTRSDDPYADAEAIDEFSR